MVDVIYQGDGKINFVCEGKSPQFDIKKGDVIMSIPKNVYDRDLKNDPRYKILKEKANQNKMEKETKGDDK